jgi:hypothetical protein
MAKQGKQQRIFEDKNDPEIVKVADRYIELRKELKSTKEKLTVQEANLIGLMRKATKPRLEHGGYTISISTDVKDKIKVKEPKKFDLM